MEPEGILQLSRIRAYPLKGAAGFDLEEAEVDSLGIRWDRRWMLVEPDGGFVSQRNHPRLALIRVAPLEEPGCFRMDAPGMEPLELSPELPLGEWIEATLHRDRLTVPRVFPGAGAWFARFLEAPCELVFIPDEVRRPVDTAFAPGHRVGFADGYPVLLATEESLSDLNRRAGRDFSMLRFRPNLVVKGGDPWEEDGWRGLEVGGARLDLVKPCARCSVTMVDPASGAAGEGPLRAMAAFRRWEGKTYFGQNAVFSRRGSFRVGDIVRIVERGEPRPPLLY